MTVERVEVKDVRVPEQLQRAMAAEAEAAREARAKVIAAEGEHKASRALRHAAEIIMDNPAALQVEIYNINNQGCPKKTATFSKIECNYYCPHILSLLINSNIFI